MENIKTLTNMPEWTAVESIIKNQISDLLDIRNISSALSSEDTRQELKARQFAVNKLLEFYNTYNFTRMKQEEIEVTFQ